MLDYRILLIIYVEKVSLFHIFTFIPEKLLCLPAFTSFHSIHVHTFIIKPLPLQSNPQKTRNFFTENNIQYTVLLKMSSTHNIRYDATSSTDIFYHKYINIKITAFIIHFMCEYIRIRLPVMRENE